MMNGKEDDDDFIYQDESFLLQIDSLVQNYRTGLGTKQSSATPQKIGEEHGLGSRTGEARSWSGASEPRTSWSQRADIQKNGDERGAASGAASGAGEIQIGQVPQTRLPPTSLSRSLSLSQPGQPGLSHLAEAGFDAAAAEQWMLPCEPKARKYQQDIACSSLFRNTLVCLPTGLGKTLVAAIVMANYRRWFPNGVVIFTAPTRPLVTQQIEACRKLMRIPEECTVELTGRKSIADREVAWQKKAIFFTTPQIVENDILRGLCPKRKIVCLVLDECHRAVGKHAYASITKHLYKEKVSFRCLGLSATPGADRARLQEVVNNLRISKVEFRAENDPEIQEFVHQRHIEKILVSSNDGVKHCCQVLESFLSQLLSELSAYGAYWTTDVSRSSRNTLLQAMQRFTSDPMRALQNMHCSPSKAALPAGEKMSRINTIFKHIIPCFSARDQLLQYGIAQTWSFIQIEMNKPTSIFGKLRSSNLKFSEFLSILGSLARRKADDPKFGCLLDILRNHFIKAHQLQRPKNVIIFTNLREKVHEIVANIKAASDGDGGAKIASSSNSDNNGGADLKLKPAAFIGQSQGKGKGAGMNQKKQQEVLKHFRKGLVNILVATCVAEEGLDIPEVSLIVCYDPSVSPGRNIQRMGRTGRKEEGRVIYLLNEGKEDRDYHDSLERAKKIHSALKDGGGTFLKLSPSCRMLPFSVSPTPALLGDLKQGEGRQEQRVKEETKQGEKLKKKNAVVKVRQGHHRQGQGQNLMKRGRERERGVMEDVTDKSSKDVNEVSAATATATATAAGTASKVPRNFSSLGFRFLFPTSKEVISLDGNGVIKVSLS